MKYFAIGIATIMICGVVGLSDSRVVAEEQPKGTEEVPTVTPVETPVEYIDFEPLHITIKATDLGKNEG